MSDKRIITSENQSHYSVVLIRRKKTFLGLSRRRERDNLELRDFLIREMRRSFCWKTDLKASFCSFGKKP